MPIESEVRFEVAISFAGKGKRNKVRDIAEVLRANLGSGRVFFDEWFEIEAAGHDADHWFQEVYAEKSRLVVACVCERYSQSAWTQEEWRAIKEFERKLRSQGQRERFLPLRFADGEVEGLFSTALIPDVRAKDAQQIANQILDRLAQVRSASAEDLPAPESPASATTTLAVILGSAQGTDDSPLDEFMIEETTRDLEAYLTSESGLALPTVNVRSWFGEYGTFDDVCRYLNQRLSDVFVESGQLAFDLLIYFVGPGEPPQRESPARITNGSMETGEAFLSRTGSELVAELVDHFLPYVRCHVFVEVFAGAAPESLSRRLRNASVGQVGPDGSIPTSLTAILSLPQRDTAECADERAAGVKLTAGMLEVLHEGHDSRGPRLSMRDLYDLASERLRVNQEPCAACTVISVGGSVGGNCDRIPIFPNPNAYQQVQAPDATDFEEEMARSDFSQDQPYLLGDTYVGREEEQRDLTLWLMGKHRIIGDASVVCICDLGGAGKTALVWHWVNREDTLEYLASQKYSRFWATFYAKDYNWSSLLVSLAKRLNLLDPSRQRDIKKLEGEGWRDLVEDILARLNEERWLIVLDGLEREMGAFDHPENQLLDSEAQDLRNERNQVSNLEKCLRTPVFAEFVRGLTTTRTKVIITSRLVPESLRDDNGETSDGVFEYPFRPLKHEDAVKVWELGGGASGPSLRDAFFVAVDFHPQVISVVSAGVGASQTTAFEEWFDEVVPTGREDYFNASADKTTLRHRWLDIATREFIQSQKKAWIVLCHVTSRSDASNLDAIAESLVGPPADDASKNKLFPTRARFIAELQKLRDQRLLGADFSRGLLDVHPVIRTHVTKYIERQFELDPFDADEEVLDNLGEAGDAVKSLLIQRQLDDALKKLDNTTMTKLEDAYGYKSTLEDIFSRFYPSACEGEQPWLQALPKLSYRVDQALCLYRTGNALMALGRWKDAPVLFRRAALAYRLCDDLESVKLCERSLNWQTLYGGSLFRSESEIVERIEEEGENNTTLPYWLALTLSIRQSEMASKLLNSLPWAIDRWTAQTVAECWYYLERYGKAEELALACARLREDASTTQQLWEHVTVGMAALRRGDLRRAFEPLHQAIEKGRRHSYPIVPMFALAGHVEYLHDSAASASNQTQQLRDYNMALSEYRGYGRADPLDQYQVPASEAHLAAARVHHALGHRQEAVDLAHTAYKVAHGLEAPFSYSAGEKRAAEFIEKTLEVDLPQVNRSELNPIVVHAHERRVRKVVTDLEARLGPPAWITNTRNWSRSEIVQELGKAQARMRVGRLNAAERSLWSFYLRSTRHFPEVPLQLIEELEARGASLSDFFNALEHSGTHNSQAGLHYLDYHRLEQELRIEGDKAPESEEDPEFTSEVRWARFPTRLNRHAAAIAIECNWSHEEAIRQYIEACKIRIGWDKLNEDVRTWWNTLANESESAPSLLGRLVAELATRNTSIQRLHFAAREADNQNIQVALHYMDYLRTRRTRGYDEIKADDGLGGDPQNQDEK